MSRRSFILTAILTAVVGILTAKYWWLISLLVIGPYMGNVQESWETSNQTFKLRIDRHTEENGGFVPGAYYVYQTAKTGSDDWKVIFTVRHDDPNPIHIQSVQFINSEIGYVFFGPKYAVTTDAGKSWVMWDAGEANKTFQFKQYSLYPSVEAAHIEPDGSGRMRLYSNTNKTPVQPELKTSDYGRRWSLE